MSCWWNLWKIILVVEDWIRPPASPAARKRDVYEFQVYKFSDLVDNILVFFEKYPILGEKAKDFSDFSIVSGLMKKFI